MTCDQDQLNLSWKATVGLTLSKKAVVWALTTVFPGCQLCRNAGLGRGLCLDVTQNAQLHNPVHLHLVDDRRILSGLLGGSPPPHAPHAGRSGQVLLRDYQHWLCRLQGARATLVQISFMVRHPPDVSTAVVKTEGLLWWSNTFQVFSHHIKLLLLRRSTGRVFQRVGQPSQLPHISSQISQIHLIQHVSYHANYARLTLACC